MSYLRTASEHTAYRRAFYPDTETYVNKLGIRDRKHLEATERALTSRRALLGFPLQAHCRSYGGFKAIHRHLFQDLYAWAGKERRYTTGRGSVLTTPLIFLSLRSCADSDGFPTRSGDFVDEGASWGWKRRTCAIADG